MRIGLFIIFWLLYYILSFIIGLFFATAGEVLAIDYLVVFSYILITSFALLFSWLYLRQVPMRPSSFYITAAVAWTVVGMLVDIGMIFIIYRMSPLTVFKPEVLLGYALVFGAVLFAGYLVRHHGTPPETPDELLYGDLELPAANTKPQSPNPK